MNLKIKPWKLEITAQTNAQVCAMTITPEDINQHWAWWVILQKLIEGLGIDELRKLQEQWEAYPELRDTADGRVGSLCTITGVRLHITDTPLDLILDLTLEDGSDNFAYTVELINNLESYILDPEPIVAWFKAHSEVRELEAVMDALGYELASIETTTKCEFVTSALAGAPYNTVKLILKYLDVDAVANTLLEEIDWLPAPDGKIWIYNA